jgi:transcriptional regulator of acetoin/glycerol metabolism
MHLLHLTADQTVLADLAVPTTPTVVLSLLEMPLTEAKRRAAADFERGYLERVMSRAQGSVSEGARRSGLDRTNFRRLLRRHGLR